MRALKLRGFNGISEYTTVAERIKWAAENLDYEVKTELLNVSPDQVVCKATLLIHTNSGDRTYVGHAQETVGSNEINKVSALENAETSALGRAFAFAGIGVTNFIASEDEVKKGTKVPSLSEINTLEELEALSKASNMKDVNVKKAFKKRHAEILMGNTLVK